MSESVLQYVQYLQYYENLYSQTLDLDEEIRKKMRKNLFWRKMEEGMHEGLHVESKKKQQL